MTAHAPIRAAIVGLGRMGRLRAQTLQQRDDVAIVSAFDPDPERFAAQFPKVPRAASLQELLASDADAVFICTPNRHTPGAIVAALEAGKHVLAEKPPGCTVEDIQRIRAAEAARPNLRLAFGFNHRFHAGIQEAHRLASSGRLGDILWIRGVYGKADPGEAWRRDPDLAGGGILLDQGIHLLDLVRMFLGDIVEVKSMVAAAHWDAPMEDNAFALLRDAAGRIAQVHSSSTQWKHRFTFEVYLQHGYLSVDGILSSSRRYGDETLTIARRPAEGGGPPLEETMYFDEDPSWAAEIDAFLACVRINTPVCSGSSEQALKAMELVHAIYRDDPAFLRAIGAPQPGDPAP